MLTIKEYIIYSITIIRGDHDFSDYDIEGYINGMTDNDEASDDPDWLPTIKWDGGTQGVLVANNKMGRRNAGSIFRVRHIYKFLVLVFSQQCLLFLYICA
jgi:hypothetical protein